MNIHDFHNDEYLKKLFSESRPELPFPDFADQVMEQISQESEVAENVTSNLRMSWIFYILGIFSGMAFTIFASNADFKIYNISLQQLLLPMLAVLSFVFIIIFEKLVKAGKSRE